VGGGVVLSVGRWLAKGICCGVATERPLATLCERAMADRNQVVCVLPGVRRRVLASDAASIAILWPTVHVYVLYHGSVPLPLVVTVVLIQWDFLSRGSLARNLDIT
jgi:hypothetical protein